MEPINKTSVVSQVVERIVDYIQSEKLSYDSKLPTEYMLCEQLNVSRSSLREAYRILQTQGLITIKAGRGAFVSNPLLSEDPFHQNQWFHKYKHRYLDLLEARGALETLAARKAAVRITKEDLARLGTNLEQFARWMLENDSNQQLADLDQEFHQIIFESSGNDFLRDINQIITKELLPYRESIMKIRTQREDTYRPHLAIYEALCSGDGEKSAKAMEQHLTLAQEAIARLESE